MKPVRQWIYRLGELILKGRREREMAEEIESHLQLHMDENMRAGMNSAEARRQALLKLGGVEPLKESYREQRGLPVMETLWHDVRYALRAFRNHPGFAAVAVMTLAMGLGMTTAIFSVVYGVLLRPLPYADPDRLVMVQTEVKQVIDKFPAIPVRARDFHTWHERLGHVAATAALHNESFNLTGAGEPEKLGGARVSANFFGLTGVAPLLGRTFREEEDRPDRDRVVVLSHGLWQRRFGGDASILHRTISLDGKSYEVIGVMPQDFLFPGGGVFHPLVPFAPRVDIWKPLALSESGVQKHGGWNFAVMARLAQGVTQAEAREQFHSLAMRNFAEDLPGNRMDIQMRVVPLRDAFAGEVRKPLLLLLAASGLVLLVACVNFANLLLSRSASRLSEFSTRLALGASRGRLIRQSLTESVLLALAGSLTGVVLAKALVSIVISQGPPEIPMLQAAAISMPVLLFAVGAALCSGLVFGLAPALTFFRTDVHGSVREGGRSSTGSATSDRLRRLFVCVEVAISMSLLASAGLLLHSYIKVLGQERGFDVERVISVDLALPYTQYQGGEKRIPFFRVLLERIRSLPGVLSAGAVSALPLTHQSESNIIYRDGDTKADELEFKKPVAMLRSVSPGYFATMRIALRAGRFFNETEPARVTVIGEKLAKQLWPGENPNNVVGRAIRAGQTNGARAVVVGVAADIRDTSLDREPMPQIYYPYSQEAAAKMSLVVRAAGEPQALAAAIRSEIRAMDANLPVPAMRTMEELVSESVARRRFQVWLILLFGGMALALASIGIYGVVSYSAAMRTREIGLRLALGAKKMDILRSVTGRGLRPVAVGLAAGLALSFASAALLRSVLYEVSPYDAATLAGAAGVLLLAALVACYVPARRASALDPMTALRHE